MRLPILTDEVDPDNTNEKLNLHKLFKKRLPLRGTYIFFASVEAI